MKLNFISAAMLRYVFIGFLIILNWPYSHAADEKYNIVTGTQNGTYIKIGNDLASYIAPKADIKLRVLSSKGSVDNIKRMRDESGTRLALIQADVYQAYKNLAAKGNEEALRIVTPLRVVAPLYNEEIYFVVRSDSPLRTISDIRNQRINIGQIGSGTAFTSAIIYQMIFGQPMDNDKISTLPDENALIALVKDKTIDVVIVIAGQPANIFLGMEPGVEKYFRLLKLDDNSSIATASGAYSKRTIRKESYPIWLNQDVSTLSVKTFLFTYDYNRTKIRRSLVRFAKSLCDNFSILQSEGHPKWQEVSLNLPSLGADFIYYPPTFDVISQCNQPINSIATPQPVNRNSSTCEPQSEAQGLCTEP